MTYRALIFDIDGTLADTLTLCVRAYQHTLERHAGRRFTEEEIIRLFGKSDEGILAAFLPLERVAGVLDDYFANYEALQRQECPEPFPGLKDAIHRLHDAGVAVAVVTGKSLRGSEVTLRILGLSASIDVLEAGFEAGPDKPESLRRALARLGLPPHEAVYVGDAAYDMEAAAAVGIPFVGAAWTATSTLRGAQHATALQVFERVADFLRWVEASYPVGHGAGPVETR